MHAVSDMQHINHNADEELNTLYMERFIMSTYTGVTNFDEIVRFLSHSVHTLCLNKKFPPLNFL